LIERTLQFVIDTCKSEPHCLNPADTFQRVCTDSRHIQPGDLFVALQGEHFNGNQFAKQALEKGASAVVLDEPVKGLTSFLMVSDGCQALGQLGAGHRREFDLPLIVVSGSNGKTSTKDMLASILRAQFETLCSEESFNNAIGVPATLLQLESRHQAAVVELGTNHPGELAPLVRMARPQYGLLTGIGHEHLEYFGNLEGVAHEEGMLAELLPTSGKLFLYGDGDWVKPMIERSQAPVVTIGFGAANDCRVENVRVSEKGTRFTLHSPTAAVCGDYQTPLLGEHQAGNAALALVAGGEMGMDRDGMADGLAATPMPRMRLQLSNRGSVRWLNDAYNANADSVRSALATLAKLRGAGKSYAVLGEMAELGNHATAAHQEAGRAAAEFVEGLIAVGQFAEETAEAAREAGLSRVAAVMEAKEAAGILRDWLQPRDLVLLKASRAARLEQVEELF
jgi:UDP-N-acetylmuramoyl-tripeptide--D-alanyl-D-alanine ligase|tara:strand:+ start:4300 stop:5655 length:1356 start_codon:yes stop_codon:yes gene_type:complete